MMVLPTCSCSRLGMYKENDFGYMMNDFYNCHFRYPKSSEDYCNMFYKNDSLNNFVFVRMMADTSEIHVKSYEEYNVFMDSIYDVHNRLGDYGIPHYFSWPRMYKNMSDDEFYAMKIENYIRQQNGIAQRTAYSMYNDKPFMSIPSSRIVPNKITAC